MPTDARGHVEFFKTEVKQFSQMAEAYGGCTAQGSRARSVLAPLVCLGRSERRDESKATQSTEHCLVIGAIDVACV